MPELPATPFSRNDVRIVQREWCYRGFVQVEKLQLQHRLYNQHGWSQTLSREIAHRRVAAGCLLLNDASQQFALIEQFRVGALNDPYSPWHLEVVAGLLDGDESPEQCLIRECVEEAGCHIAHLEAIAAFYPSAGASSEYFHLYAAQAELPENGSVFGLPSEGEDIRLHIFDYAMLDALLDSGRLQNGVVILALQWLKLRLLSGLQCATPTAHKE